MYGLEGSRYTTLDEVVKKLYHLPRKTYKLDVYVNDFLWKTQSIEYKDGRYSIQNVCLSELFPVMKFLEETVPVKQKNYSVPPSENPARNNYEERRKKVLAELEQQRTEAARLKAEQERQAEQEEQVYQRQLKYGALIQLKKIYYELDAAQMEEMDSKNTLRFQILTVMDTKGELSQGEENIEQEQILFDDYMVYLKDEFEEEDHAYIRVFQ